MTWLEMWFEGELARVVEEQERQERRACCGLWLKWSGKARR